ncbi:MAG: heavy metal translocating P-type ATPase [Lachnospiraceae bacterium]|nr:heavy metal translocating P-type ATPase [Lachnospiraceae bacterium]
MKQYYVTGMSCAACSARVEKAVSGIPGVTSVSVNLLTNAMAVRGDVSPETVIRAVEDAGYGASLKDPSGTGDGFGSKTGSSNGKTTGTEPLNGRKPPEVSETRQLVRRLVSSSLLTLVLMYFSMGHCMWGWPVPVFLRNNIMGQGLLQLLLSSLILLINRRFFISGFKALRHLAPNMDTLVSLGSMTSYLWSIFMLFRMSLLISTGANADAAASMDLLYFESASMILTLITVGKTLESYSKGKTTDALKGLMELSPQTARLVRDGAEVTVPVEEVKIGDVFALRPGDSIPVDGVILEGSSAIDESALTGESIPADKGPGDKVFTATLNRSGYLRARAEKVGQDTTLAGIIRLVSDASATKAPIGKIADKVSGIFVPVVISIALITFLVWLLTGAPLYYALERGISVLVISCPCALGLATPVAIMVGSGKGARSGILFKTAAAQEETGRIQIVALDKTGTITEGSPAVTDILCARDIPAQALVSTAMALEQHSEHPLARAIMTYGAERQISYPEVENFRAITGSGLSAILNGITLTGGSLRFIRSLFPVDAELEQAAEDLSDRGKTPLLFAAEGKVLGLIAVADPIKAESPEAIRQLKAMGIRVIMLTGDNEKTAGAIGVQAGVDEVVSDVLPGEKEAVICLLKQQGKVAMVGDGINDAPALTAADMGIAIGAGTDIAIDAAQVVLMKSRLTDVPAAIRLSRRTLKIIRENLFWAFFYNVIGIPLAAGCFIPLFGWELAPMFGAAAMSLSSFCVVSNALRLNVVKVTDPGRDRPGKNALKTLDMTSIRARIAPEPVPVAPGSLRVKATFRIEGMMCPHCEDRVKKALEALPFIEEALPSYEKGCAVCTLAGTVDEAMLQSAITEAGYEYISRG